MSPGPPVITRLPLRSATDLIALAPIRLWVPTARLLRKTLTLAPPLMARSVSTIDELPIGALPAATCCSERVLAPELMRSKSRPSSRKKPFLSATMAGQMVTLTLITTTGSGVRACATAAPASTRPAPAMRHPRKSRASPRAAERFIVSSSCNRSCAARLRPAIFVPPPGPNCGIGRIGLPEL
jgi:hypothetical protein